MKKIKIYVTSDCIKAGKPDTSGFCPVALAIKKKLKNNFVCVGDESIEIWGTNYTIIEPPKSVTKFVHAFDQGKKVKPFNFTLKV